jgi:hypothetical protein
MRFLFSIAMLAAVWTAGAQGTSAIQGYDNPSSGLFSSTAGWSFQPATNLTVTQLGCLANFFINNPEASQVQVGLWSVGGSLLASNSITLGSSNIDQSRYESVTPVQLSFGNTYLIGAYSSIVPFRLDSVVPGFGGSVAPSRDILSLTSAEGISGFAIPSGGANGGVANGAFLGPNFRYDGGIPEPSSTLLLGLGGLLLAARRGKQRH